jgi:hypothetical protein
VHRVLIETPGIYDIPADAYHADPCPAPSLSSSIAKLLCQSSPAHARVCHPRLCDHVVEEDAEHFDIGSAAHAILLEGVNSVAIIDAKDWRTNAAKDARDQARQEGRIPLLKKVWADVEAMVLATRAQLDAHEDGREMFCAGKPEQTLVWREGDLWCRARLDWLRVGNIDDYKTTKASANPEAISRTLFANGWDVQAAFYLRGLKALTGVDGTFRFAAQETYPPYALSVVALGPDAMTLAEKKVRFALELWHDSLTRNTWPAYPLKTAYAGLPPWIEAAWLEKELQEVR